MYTPYLIVVVRIESVVCLIASACQHRYRHVPRAFRRVGLGLRTPHNISPNEDEGLNINDDPNPTLDPTPNPTLTHHRAHANQKSHANILSGLVRLVKCLASLGSSCTTLCESGSTPSDLGSKSVTHDDDDDHDNHDSDPTNGPTNDPNNTTPQHKGGLGPPREEDVVLGQSPKVARDITTKSVTTTTTTTDTPPTRHMGHKPTLGMLLQGLFEGVCGYQSHDTPPNPHPSEVTSRLGSSQNRSAPKIDRDETRHKGSRTPTLSMLLQDMFEGECDDAYL